MMYHIYKIVVWNGSERRADIDCSINTQDPELTLQELHTQDLGVEMNKYSRITIKYIERPDLTVTKYKVGWVNKARERKIEFV